MPELLERPPIREIAADCTPESFQRLLGGWQVAEDPSAASTAGRKFVNLYDAAATVWAEIEYNFKSNFSISIEESAASVESQMKIGFVEILSALIGKTELDCGFPRAPDILYEFYTKKDSKKKPVFVFNPDVYVLIDDLTVCFDRYCERLSLTFPGLELPDVAKEAMGKVSPSLTTKPGGELEKLKYKSSSKCPQIETISKNITATVHRVEIARDPQNVFGL